MASWPDMARRIRVPVGFLFAVVYLWLARPTPQSIGLGAALIVPGLMVRGLASGYVQKNEQLTTSGPYAYTRNPLYLGSLILAAGFAVAARSWWIAGLMAVIFIAIYVPVIGFEETFLRQRFPEYAEYARRVPRLFPRFRAPAAESRFAWNLYSKHREYNAAVGAMAMLAALAVKLFWTSK